MMNAGVQVEGKHGQALVIVALAIVALAAIVGLAIDGGRLYELRRQVQNGADAAAMAGTRELAQMISECANPTPANDLLVAAKVLEFAALNGVEETSPDGDVTAWYVDKNSAFLGWVGAGGIPSGSTGVVASLVATDTTTFMKVLGQEHIRAAGDATAMAGPVTAMGGGMLPIAVPEIIIDELNPGDIFNMKDDGTFCRTTGDIVGSPPPCEDISDNAPQSQRGWLQLSHIFNYAGWSSGEPRNRVFTNNMGAGGACNSDLSKIGLNGWADRDCPYPYLIYAGNHFSLDGDFIAGKTGNVASALGIIYSKYSAGDVAYVPVFDYIYTGTCKAQKGEVCMETVFSDVDEPAPGINWVSGGTGYYYHIVGYAAVELQAKISNKDFYGSFVSATIKGGAITPGEGIASGGCSGPLIIGVTLWE